MTEQADKYLKYAHEAAQKHLETLNTMQAEREYSFGQQGRAEYVETIIETGEFHRYDVWSFLESAAAVSQAVFNQLNQHQRKEVRA